MGSETNREKHPIENSFSKSHVLRFAALRPISPVGRRSLSPSPGSELFGRAFEHFIILEILAHSRYSDINYPLQYWRTASQFEVDLILGRGEVAVEIKSTTWAKDRHLKGLRAFKEEHNSKYIFVSLDPKPRKTSDGILILPWKDFLENLWTNKIIS